MKRYFVTSSGTNIGKTFVTAGLAHAFIEAGHSVRVAKPVISGFAPETVQDSDMALLLKAVRLPLMQENIDACSPWRFRAALSPDMAAAREQREIDFGALVECCQTLIAGPEEAVLIEGVGGIMVPLTQSHTVLDWMSTLDMPAILVVGSYLGTISHTLSALHVLKHKGIDVAAIIVSESLDNPVSLAETVAVIERFAAGTTIIGLPRMADWRLAQSSLLSLL